MRKAVWLIAGGLVLLSTLAAIPAEATDYSWTENERWTWLYPSLQQLTLYPDDTLWIGWGDDPGEKWFADAVQMTNYGTITWADGNSTMWTSNGSNLLNCGLLDLQASGNFWKYPCAGGGWNTLSNLAGGTLRKSVSAGDVTLSFTNCYPDEARFINAGTLDCQVGRLNYNLPMMYFQDGTRFAGPGTHRVSVASITEFNGSITADPGTTLEFDARLWSGSPWVQFRGTPATLHGEVHLLVGDLYGTWTIAPDGTVTNAVGLPARVDGTLDNLGVINVYGDLYTNATTTNHGMIDFRADDNRVGRSDSSWPTLINEGIIRKSIGAGRSILGTDGQPDLNLTNAAAGVIDVQTGTLSVFASDFNQNAGRLHAAVGAQLEIQTYWPNPLTSSGVIDGGGTLRLIGGQPLLNHGQIMPGDGTGTLTIAGGFTQETGGELTIDLSGASGGQFDQLAITGTAVLGGRLRVRAVSGFVPADQTTFVILTCADRQQAFTETIFELPFGTTAEVIYGPTTVIVKIHSLTSDVVTPEDLGPRLRVLTTAGARLIVLDLPTPSDVRLAVFDPMGREADRLSTGGLRAGRHEWQWNGSDARRPSGVYFVRAELTGAAGTTALHARTVVVR